MCRAFFFFQAEDGIRDLVRSRGLGDVYKRQLLMEVVHHCTSKGLGGDSLAHEDAGFTRGVKGIGRIISLSLIHI